MIGRRVRLSSSGAWCMQRLLSLFTTVRLTYLSRKKVWELELHHKARVDISFGTWTDPDVNSVLYRGYKEWKNYRAETRKEKR